MRWLCVRPGLPRTGDRTTHGEPAELRSPADWSALGRFTGWALAGATTITQDFWTGALSLIRRPSAFALVAVTFLERRTLRGVASSRTQRGPTDAAELPLRGDTESPREPQRIDIGLEPRRRERCESRACGIGRCSSVSAPLVDEYPQTMGRFH